VDFNSFTPLGERLSLVAFSAPDFREDHVFQGIEQFRPGSGGLLATVSFAYGYSRPGGDLSPLKLDSKSYVGAFNLSLPLIRGRDENANIEGGLDIVDQSLYSFVTPDVRATLSDDRLSVLHLKIGGDRDWRTLESPVKISGDIEARQGVSSFGASNAGDPLLSRSGGQPDAWDLRAQGFFNVQWLPQFGTSLSLTGQYARERLLAYEDFNVGNLTVVRGYDPAALTGDEGVGGAFQANVGGFRLTDMLEVGGYGFYDMAYVKNFDVSDEDAVVRSIGAGATFNLSYWSQWSADVAYAHPLGTGSLLPQERPSSNRILVNLTYQY
jgi:hemolysin activation/secretion protein